MEENNDQITAEEKSLLDEVPTLYSVESAIKTRNQKLNDLKKKMRDLNEMLKSYLENDDEYREAAKAAKDSAARKKAIKQRLMSDPAAKDLPARIDEAREEKRDLQESLSYYLTEYARLSGTNEFEDENGDLKQIVYSARLVKRSGGN